MSESRSKPQLPERNDIGEGSNKRNDQSEAILRAIAKYGGRPVTLSEIMSEIGDDYKKSSTKLNLFYLKIEGMVIRHKTRSTQDALWSLRGGSKLKD